MSSKAEDNVVIRNIYYMMAYAYRALDIGDYTRLASEEFESANDLLAAILEIGMTLQLKRGLERGYVELDEEMAGIRGHLDAPGTMRLSAVGVGRTRCRYDEMSEDTLKNRILKATALALVGCEDVGDARRRGLKRCLLKMRDVGGVDPSRVEWGRLAYHRNNGGYQMLMAVCYMVAQAAILTEADDGASGRSFISDRELSALYEKFVLEYFRRHHPELKASAKVIKPAEGEARPAFLPALNTDVTLEGDAGELIIDCKCYGQILQCHYGHEALSPDNVNQIHMYVTEEAYATGRHVEGMLLYAKTGEDVEHGAWSTAGYEYHLRMLDLGVEFGEIAGQLDGVAGMVIWPRR
ncbi:5-methylcytosine restriction system specificity protein McrC [Paratractidigestivibacter sp.]|uniref:5-methylcytosine restriction system specificity protein McrC n=1 Tax=Paratractidigestivibacter sp. TaxID=2847316 RepID=UPI002ACB14D2|nr:hypothetical protein [Paratractidigestivibacter sp.]